MRLGCASEFDELVFGRGDNMVGNPHRAQISRFELVELILLLKSDKQLPVERFEAAVSQSTVPSPPLFMWAVSVQNGHRMRWPPGVLCLHGVLRVCAREQTSVN